MQNVGLFHLFITMQMSSTKPFPRIPIKIERSIYQAVARKVSTVPVTIKTFEED